MIELALPAGSLETALTAFKSGADAVYFGLKEFSARKTAINFSIEDLSKIRRYSLDNSKKIYITINTLIDDADIDRVLRLLDQVSFYGNDGIIIQDLGVAQIIKKYYPSLSLHASTQLAVHTTEGVRELQDLGFERVVLSRELTFNEIKKIRQECPDIEIKAFIHGALCYGFSGICSASFLKCGRSANGGACAQICRSWFTDNKDGKKGYFFSMEDLDIGEKLIELDEIGIDSAKIEGRLKSPEYVASCTRYYRSILDRHHTDFNEKDNVATTFQRKHGTGYLDYKPNRPSLLSGNYPGHIGLECGRIIKQTSNSITVETNVPIESHDGLQYFTQNHFELSESKQFSASVIRKEYSTTTLFLKTSENLRGKTIYKISDSTNREKTPSTNIPAYRKPIDIRVTLTNSNITASALGKEVSKQILLQEAKNPINPEDILIKHFTESGDSRFTLKELLFENLSTFKCPFFPPSIIKEFRRDFYSIIDQIEIKSPLIIEPEKMKKSVFLPNRNLLCKDLPWSLEPTEIGGKTFFTFPPVTFAEEELFKTSLEIFSNYKNATIGINNISQIRFAKKHPEFDYFADIYLYLSNRYTAQVITEEVPNLIGGYLWFERKEKSGIWPFEPTVVSNFEPPAFISRTCFRHDAKGESCTGCSKHYNYSITQEPDTYTVKVRNCLTVVERNR